MASTARSIPPDRKRAVDRDHENENVFDWLRRQSRADRKPIPPRGITQTAPARVLDAMTTAINKKTTPVAPDAVKDTEK